MNIDVNKLEAIKEDLKSLNGNDYLLIEENGKVKYAIMPIEKFDETQEIASIAADAKIITPQFKELTGEDLSYEEYERIKQLIMEAVEKTLKPKAEKLN